MGSRVSDRTGPGNLPVIEAEELLINVEPHRQSQWETLGALSIQSSSIRRPAKQTPTFSEFSSSLATLHLCVICDLYIYIYIYIYIYVRVGSRSYACPINRIYIYMVPSQNCVWTVPRCSGRMEQRGFVTGLVPDLWSVMKYRLYINKKKNIYIYN